MAPRSVLQIRNPHSILEALRKRPGEVMAVHPPRNPSGAWQQVVAMAEKCKRPVRTSGTGIETSFAEVGEVRHLEIEEILPREISTAGSGLWLALDQVQDPMNLGAIIRTAAFFGVRGVVVPRDRSSPFTAAVYDTASGGMEHVPVAQVTNLSQALGKAKEMGLWILGSTEHRGDPLHAIPRDRNWMVVVGNEESGMRRLTEESCDLLCRIPNLGGVTSLNVSVATGVLLSGLVASP